MFQPPTDTNIGYNTISTWIDFIMLLDLTFSVVPTKTLVVLSEIGRDKNILYS